MKYVHEHTFSVSWIPESILTLSVPTPQNGQTHCNNSLAVAYKLFECVWRVCGVGAEKVKKSKMNIVNNNMYIIF